MSTDDFRVLFEKYTDRHYIKDFSKKYRTQWPKTRVAIVATLARIDNVIASSRADRIKFTRRYWLIKLDFAIAGSKESPKSSGHRLIALVDLENRTVHVLLVYGKNHICEPNETQKWQQVIRDQYLGIWNLFKNHEPSP